VIKQAIVKPPENDASNSYYSVVANKLQGKEIHSLSKYLGSDTGHPSKCYDKSDSAINYAGNPILRELLLTPE
jgi:hypothetical protein